MRFVVLANPANRRVRFFQEALATYGHPPARICPWSELLHTGPAILSQHLEAATDASPSARAILRIDSPEGDQTAYQQFLLAGAHRWPHDTEGKGERIDATAASDFPFDGSGLRFVRQRHLGFFHLLSQIKGVTQRLSVHCTHPPDDIALMSHKARCHQYLVDAGLPLPDELPLQDADTAMTWVEETQEPIFVKLWHGSSAAGIGALRPTDAGLCLLSSTVLAHDGPFSSLQLRQYECRNEIKRILSWLYAEGAHTQRWVPKLDLAGREFDLRVVAIAGQARHVAVRVSAEGRPMTNLHFGNERGHIPDVIERIGTERWAQGLALCERAAATFPESLCVGFDLMFDLDAEPILIEANPFGDLLPRITSREQNTYEAQVTAAIERYST